MSRIVLMNGNSTVKKPAKADQKAQVIAVSSGKGGVGKSSICANLGILLADQGLKVCIVDADHGLANINIILGLPPAKVDFDIFTQPEDVLLAIQKSKYEVDILSSRSGVSQNADNLQQNVHLNDNRIPEIKPLSILFDELKKHYDVILIDTAAGINRAVKHYLAVADFVLLVLMPEPTSLTDGFGLVRAMKEVNNAFQVVTNRVSGAPQANNIYRRFSNAVKKFIGLDISLLGYINEDPYLPFAVLRQLPIVRHRPDCPATHSLNRLSQTIARNFSRNRIQTKTVNVAEETKKGAEDTKKLPAKLTFMKTRKEALITPFEKWLDQLPEFFSGFSDSRQERIDRFTQFRNKLQDVVKKDADFEKSFMKFAEEVRKQKMIKDSEAKQHQELTDSSGDTNDGSDAENFSEENSEANGDKNGEENGEEKVSQNSLPVDKQPPPIINNDGSWLNNMTALLSEGSDEVNPYLAPEIRSLPDQASGDSPQGLSSEQLEPSLVVSEDKKNQIEVSAEDISLNNLSANRDQSEQSASTGYNQVGEPSAHEKEVEKGMNQLLTNMLAKNLGDPEKELQNTLNLIKKMNRS